MRVAVIYWSFEGNTRSIAKKIADKFSADIYELNVKNNKLPKSGFFKYFWGGKQVFMKETPELINFDINVDDYDVIFIGTPVWSFTYAPALRSFFKKYNITNKKVALFCSHSGGSKNTILDMKDRLPQNEFIGEIEVLEPLKNEEKTDKQIEEWLQNIKF